MVARGNTSSAGAKDGADPATCQKSLLNPTQAQFDEFKQRIQEKLVAVRESYNSVLAEANAIGVLQQRIQKADTMLYAEIAGRFSPGIANHLAKMK
ncbi:hypothetical protein EG829_22555 [bacterium]|nr:hypothetical protein [bacterium]